MEPRAHSWEANGLTQHVLEWSSGSAPAEADDARPTALIVHGFQDAAATWDDVAAALAEGAGLRVLAPDMRGFGDGPRVPRGAYYYFPDYVADVAAIVRDHVVRVPAAPLFVVGHSMGATIVTYFAGAFPELVTKLALIDGVGPMGEPPDYAPLRMRGWIDGVTRVQAAPERAPFATLDEAAARLARHNPNIDEAVLRRRASQLARADASGVGFHWKHDPLHGTRSPLSFFADTYKAFARQVTGPVLHVSGGVQGHHVPDEEERLACFPRMTRATIEGGHALHWSQPRALGDALVRFWST
jgi:pimeloyl-ACP methyl ester carboxylesterase